MGEVFRFINYLLFALRKIYLIKIDLSRIRDTYNFLLTMLYKNKKL